MQIDHIAYGRGLRRDEVANKLSQSVVVPVPACCATDTAQYNCQFFSAGRSCSVSLAAKLQFSGGFSLLVALRYTASI